MYMYFWQNIKLRTDQEKKRHPKFDTKRKTQLQNHKNRNRNRNRNKTITSLTGILSCLSKSIRLCIA